MKPEKEPKIGSCYECSTKEKDSSQKKVYYCELCGKWFCERHREPKFPYFIDWDTIFDVQGNPEIKLRYYNEYRREGGHPDFVYWRRTVEALDIEEKTRNELIKQAMDRMMHSEKHGVEVPVDDLADRNKRVEMLLREEIELSEKAAKTVNTAIPFKKGETTKTYDNVYHHHFWVPVEVYSDIEYRDRLNNARTLEEAEQIIEDYNKRYRKETEQEKPKNKKHWWQ
jgi:hypothetical protein